MNYKGLNEKLEGDMAEVSKRLFRLTPISSSEHQQLIEHDPEFTEFLKRGGEKSGVYDISDPKVNDFVIKYSRYIPKDEIYERRDGTLTPYFMTTLPASPQLDKMRAAAAARGTNTVVSSAKDDVYEDD